ncbi:hypothetical protein CEXT_436241 [Caerostris extrusa]|uniref:Uncharacterized protein n=1 Tax=Caerostris extrusa TaxID=172846 RepID=A0AAV4MX96_CAEEX|nr:hypothetical protein CEXT_436241 [Caerostris extrusa]
MLGKKPWLSRLILFVKDLQTSKELFTRRMEHGSDAHDFFHLIFFGHNVEWLKLGATGFMVPKKLMVYVWCMSSWCHFMHQASGQNHL